MSAADDGGPAFPLFTSPSETGGNIPPIQYGMTLRDWFAGQALAGISAPSCGYEVQRAAQRSYELADAMLAARKQ